MSQPDDPNRKALKSLDDRIDAFEAKRRRDPHSGVSERGASEGYRLLGEVIGGVFGGLGFGWLFDHFLHTTPWGLVTGMMLGTAMAAYTAYKSASRTAGKVQQTQAAPPPPAADDDEDE
jgi:ATP synthase protein I